jgi:hypothetical protein
LILTCLKGINMNGENDKLRNPVFCLNRHNGGPSGEGYMQGNLRVRFDFRQVLE